MFISAFRVFKCACSVAMSQQTPRALPRDDGYAHAQRQRQRGVKEGEGRGRRERILGLN